jgi:pyridoxine kinase
MNILSIQSWVSYGHVGNASAVFPLQRLGAEVWSINTVQFSNHTGYGHWTGQVYSGESVRELVDGIEARDVLKRCDAVLSGYMGDAAIGAAVLHAVDRVRRANPDAIYCCDPVIGDTDTGSYVRDGVAEFFRDHALAAADIVTPNRFELEFLTGETIGSLSDAADAAAKLRGHGPQIVLVTSLDATPDRLTMLASGADGAWVVETPRLPAMLNGCGDVTAALFLGRLLGGESLADALAHTAASMFAIIKRTVELGRYELALVASREELVRPSQVFEAKRI